jgi:hypothetical protein
VDLAAVAIVAEQLEAAVVAGTAVAATVAGADPDHHPVLEPEVLPSDEGAG